MSNKGFQHSVRRGADHKVLGERKLSQSEGEGEEEVGAVEELP
jgi:hypothetical protein